MSRGGVLLGLTTAWVVPALGAGWSAQGAPYQVPRYRARYGVVYVEGLVFNNTAGALGPANPVFVLPANMRPPAHIDAPPFSGSTLEVQSNGVVAVNNSIAAAAILSLHISFALDP